MLTFYAIYLLIASLFSFANCLQWYNITRPFDRGALCNDFTPAGYFIHKHPDSSNWVIFLEGGGGCNSPRKCNERYIDHRIRRKFTFKENGTVFVNVVEAWNTYMNDRLTASSRLMTSLWRFANIPKGGNAWIIEGRDLLSKNQESNPLFYNYNHVLIPYCSSDLWLRATNNYKFALNTEFRFNFDPQATSNQFTFRGAAIYQSVILDLFEFHNLSKASDVILGGTSAGGVGSLNHAQWTLDKLNSRATDARLSVITDSAWFIDFQNIISKQFSNDDVQLDLDEDNNSVCYNIENPSLCISAPLILTDNSIYPNIPTLAIFSQYDLYVLSQSLLDVTVNTGVIEIMRIVSEYSGSMNTSLQDAMWHYSNLSYFVTSCFQHVYFATSDLWGNPSSILGDEQIGVAYENNKFTHKVHSDVWTSFGLLLPDISNSSHRNTITIAQAIEQWLHVRYSGDVIMYSDNCSGPRCNSQCPEEIVLGKLGVLWPFSTQILPALLVVCLAIMSVVLKIVLLFHYKLLKKRQKIVIENAETDPYKGMKSNLPYCDEKNAISVACLNLRYSVTLTKSALKKAANSPDGGQKYKRLLSISAGNTDDDTLQLPGRQRMVKRSTMDVETGQSVMANTSSGDMIQTIQQFQQQYQRRKQPQDKRLHLTNVPFISNQKKKEKEIIRGVSAYFNPGELVAILGPSGCGKTTFLDLLAGRHDIGSYQGNIFVNGTSLEKVRGWYIAHTGYVLQLATPYYSTLTVRENLTFAAQMRLPKQFTMKEKLERVEQILKETGLSVLADTPVGSSVGPGLSGGQKRRLCVALQLLNMPSLIFLDEPTSGLDAASSLELLHHLNHIAASNRTVILTIHQPRLEIFHMFSQIILLCQGQIAYHGVPENAYQFFVNAHLNAHLAIKKIQDSTNPADVIMDMLGSEQSRLAILKHFTETQESQKVKNAVKAAQISFSEMHEQRKKSKTAGLFNHIAALEGRAKKRAQLGQTLYLPSIFAIYGLLLGTVYIQTQNATSILTGFGVFICASGLFMFPAIYNYLLQALNIFSLEYSDGIGQAHELVLQTFIRFVSLAAIPVITGATIAYLLIIPYSQYNFMAYVETVIFNLALNHTWIGLLMFVITAVPTYAHRISPVLSAIAGFSGGFFVPPSLMPKWYVWLFYINPNYYGFSAIIRVILQDISPKCNYQSSLECYPSTGEYLLSYFSLDNINPTLHLLLLQIMTGSLVLLSWVALLLRHSLFVPRVTSFFKSLIRNHKKDKNTGHHDLIMPAEEKRSFDDQTFSSVDCDGKQSETNATLSQDDSVFKEYSELDINIPDFQKRLNSRSSSLMLHEGKEHDVWRPGKRLSITGLNDNIEVRRRTLLQRVNSYHGIISPGDDDSMLTKPRRRNQRSGNLSSHIIEQRMRQWKKIEQEAMLDNTSYLQLSPKQFDTVSLQGNRYILSTGPELDNGVVSSTTSVSSIPKSPLEAKKRPKHRRPSFVTSFMEDSVLDPLNKTSVSTDAPPISAPPLSLHNNRHFAFPDIMSPCDSTHSIEPPISPIDYKEKGCLHKKLSDLSWTSQTLSLPIYPIVEETDNFSSANDCEKNTKIKSENDDNAEEEHNDFDKALPYEVENGLETDV